MNQWIGNRRKRIALALGFLALFSRNSYSSSPCGPLKNPLAVSVLLNSGGFPDESVKATPAAKRSSDRGASDEAERGFRLERYEVLGGIGFSHQIFSKTQTVLLFGGMERLVFFLSKKVSFAPAFFQCYATHPIHGGGFGTGPEFRIKLYRDSFYDVFLDLGVGAYYMNLAVPELGRKLNFSWQAGIGFSKNISNRSFAVIEYRFLHLSNAGTRESNIGLNASYFLFGYGRRL